MNSRIRLARLLLTIPALLLAVVPPIADLNASHVLNPSWTAHARLHTVWLVCSNFLIAIIALGILWRSRADASRASIALAAALVGSVLLGFFVAAATQGAYGGALTDPDGISIRFGPFDANLVTFSVCSILVLIAFSLSRKAVV